MPNQIFTAHIKRQYSQMPNFSEARTIEIVEDRTSDILEKHLFGKRGIRRFATAAAPIISATEPIAWQ